MLNTLLKTGLNIFHVFIGLLPILIYLFPKYIVKPYIHWILLIMVMTPLHWVFFENKCILTHISSYLGDYDNVELETDAAFTESNFKWLYNPIMKIFGWEWNNKNVDKMLTLHWIINILLVWFYAFYMCGDAKLPETHSYKPEPQSTSQLTSVVSQEPIVSKESVIAQDPVLK